MTLMKIRNERAIGTVEKDICESPKVLEKMTKELEWNSANKLKYVLRLNEDCLIMFAKLFVLFMQWREDVHIVMKDIDFSICRLNDHSSSGG